MGYLLVYADLPITRGNAKEKGVNTDKKKLYYASHIDAMDCIGESSYPIANREEVHQKNIGNVFYISKRVKINFDILLCLRNFFLSPKTFLIQHIPTVFIF